MYLYQSNVPAEATVKLNASGNGTALVQNMKGPRWQILQIAVTVSTHVLAPQCRTFIGTDANGRYVSQTYTGDDDTDSMPNITLNMGESLAAVWTGGDVGSIAKLTVIYNEVP